MNEEIELIQEEIAAENAEIDKVATAIEVLPPVHTSFESAYQVESYPYGRRLRCKRRVWIEHNPRHGYRFVHCTSNPKKSGLVWNTPHYETYATAIALYRDLADSGHIKTASMSHVWDIDKARDFLAKYGAGLTPDMIEEFKRQVRETIHQGMKPSYRTTSIIDVGSVTRQREEILPRFTQEEGMRLLAEFAPARAQQPAKPVACDVSFAGTLFAVEAEMHAGFGG